jgi:hypothetical protein
VTSFPVVQLESFLMVEYEYVIETESSKVYKYISEGHGVSSSLTPELMLYSTLVDTMCKAVAIRQDGRLRAMTGEDIVATICSMFVPQRWQSSSH